MRKLPAISLGLVLLATISCGGSPTAPLDPSQGLSVPFAQTDLIVGSGRQAANGDRLTVNYTLWLYDPTKGDNKGRQLQSGPFQFTLGAGQVIRGFDQGVPGMAIGGKRRLVIPPSLAYGSAGSPPDIPPNATIVFEVELVNIA